MVEPGRPGPPTFFFRGALGGCNLRVHFYNIASALMHLKLNRPTIEIKTTKNLKFRDVFLKILFVGWRKQKPEAKTVGLKPTSSGHVTCGQAKYGL